MYTTKSSYLMDAHGNKIFCKTQWVQIFFEGEFCFHAQKIKPCGLAFRIRDMEAILASNSLHNLRGQK